MIERVKFRWQLWRIEAWQRKNSKTYKKAIKAARLAKKDRNEIASLKDEDYSEWRNAEEEKLDLRSRHLLWDAQKLLIPTPDKKEAWEEGHNGYDRLTISAQADLLRAIRTERKERSEVIRSWLPTILSIVSALAAWTAILSR